MQTKIIICSLKYVRIRIDACPCLKIIFLKFSFNVFFFFDFDRIVLMFSYFYIILEIEKCPQIK